MVVLATLPVDMANATSLEYNFKYESSSDKDEKLRRDIHFTGSTFNGNLQIDVL